MGTVDGHLGLRCMEVHYQFCSLYFYVCIVNNFSIGLKKESIFKNALQTIFSLFLVC